MGETYIRHVELLGFEKRFFPSQHYVSMQGFMTSPGFSAGGLGSALRGKSAMYGNWTRGDARSEPLSCGQVLAFTGRKAGEHSGL